MHRSEASARPPAPPRAPPSRPHRLHPVSIVFFLAPALVAASTAANPAPADRAEELERGARSLLDEIRAVDVRRAALGDEIRTARAEHTTAQVELTRAELAVERSTTELATSRDKLERRIRSTWRMHGVDSLAGILTAGDWARAARRSTHLEAIVRHDTNVVRYHAERVSGHTDRVRSLERRRTELASRAARLNALETDLTHESETKRKLLGRVLAEREQALRAEALAQASVDAATDGARALPSGGATGRRDGVERWRGRMPPPVDGPVVVPYGSRRDPVYGTVTFSKGVVLQAREHAPVRASLSGRVAFRGYVSGFGNLLILDHGSDYYTVYGHLEDVRSDVGTLVLQGTPLAEAGVSGLAREPQVYFEIRRGSRALDPGRWLASGAAVAERQAAHAPDGAGTAPRRRDRLAR